MTSIINLFCVLSALFLAFMVAITENPLVRVGLIALVFVIFFTTQALVRKLRRKKEEECEKN